MNKVDRILEQIALLSPDEIAELHARLDAFAEPSGEGAFSAEWGAEIARRVESIRSGESTPVEATEAFEYARARLKAIRA